LRGRHLHHRHDHDEDKPADGHSRVVHTPTELCATPRAAKRARVRSILSVRLKCCDDSQRNLHFLSYAISDFRLLIHFNGIALVKRRRR
jgi:hypothetical protein